MSINAYAVFFPASGKAMPGNFATDFPDPTKVDLFASPGPALTNVSFYALSSWQTSVEQTVDITSSGSGAGVITFNQVSLSRIVDSVTSAFLVLCAQGSEFKYVDVIFQNGTQAKGSSFLAFRYGQAVVREIDWSSSFEGENVTEVVDLEYGTLDIGYSAVNSKGVYGPPQFRGWDRINNVRI